MWHVIPVNDIFDHEVASTCNCKPKMIILENGDFIFVHNAYDHREEIENLINICNN